jgi:integrase
VRRKADGKLSRAFFVILEDKPAADGTRKRRKVTVGDYPTFSTDAARAEAQKMLQAHASGDDPAAQRKAKREAPTFDDLADTFIAQYLPSKRPRTAADYRERIDRRLRPEFGRTKVAAIDARAVREFVRAGSDRPTDTNRALAVLSSMMAFAVEEELRPDNPCRGIRRYKEAARDAWIDELDMPRYLEALSAVKGPHGDLLRFLTITGWRISEARELTWDMLDLRRLVANLPDTKTGQQDRQLSADAVTIISGQKHRSGYVFSKTGRQMLDYKHCGHILSDVCTAAGIKRVTLHALRHSAATWSAMAGASAFELRETIGWSSLAMANRYVSKAERLGRRGVERAAEAIDVLRRRQPT